MSGIQTNAKGAYGACLAATRAMVRREMRGLFLIGFVVNLLVLVSPIYMLQIYDRVLTSGSTDTLVYLTLIALFALAIYGLLDLLRGRILTRLGYVVDDLLHAPALASWFDTAGRNSTSGSMLADLHRVRSLLQSGLPNILLDAPWAPVFIVVLFLLHPLLGVIGLLSTIALMAMGVVNDLGARKSLNEGQKLKSTADELIASASTNVDTIASMGMMDAIVARHRAAATRAARMEIKGLDFVNSVSSMSKAFRIAVQVGILGAGAWLVLRNSLTPGGMIAASILLGRALAPAEQSIGAWRQVAPARESWRRISQSIAALSEMPRRMELPAPTGLLEIDGVGLAAPEGLQPLLDDITITLKPGDICAVLGPTGSGKSTLCRIVAGSIRPTTGKVRFDGTAVQDWLPRQLGDQIGYVSQDAEIFQGTIAQNISRLDKPRPDMVVEAARAAGIYDMIARLPNGFATPVGSGGLRLSGGQRQRVALARALYGSPRYLILDEPNANLDELGERALREALAGARARGATILLVIHRGLLLTIANKLLLLENGRQTMFGDAAAVASQVRAMIKVAQPPRTQNASSGVSDQRAEEDREPKVIPAFGIGAQ